MRFDYYYGSEADQFTFVKLPKTILFHKAFEELSLVAKVLYGLLLDRMSLSKRNNWLDEENRVFIIYQITEIQEDLGLSKKKAIECLAELEKFGLVEKKRRGQGLPNILYVKNFNGEEELEEDTEKHVEEILEENNPRDKSAFFRSVKKGSFRSTESETSRSAKSDTSMSVYAGTSKGAKTTPQEVTEMAPVKSKREVNNTYTSNNNINNIYENEIPIESYHISEDRGTMPVRRCDEDEMMAYAEIIKENIEFESLLEKYPYEQGMVEGIYELILETVLGKGESVLIASNKYPRKLVKGKFLKLDSGHVEYVIDCVQKNTTKVRNIKKYLLAALFNAPTTMEGYYRSEVNHDFPELVG